MDEDAVEAIEYDVTTVLMKARRKTGPSQTGPHYYQLENAQAQNSTTPYMTTPYMNMLTS